jgi:hypothetical protein
MALWDKGYNVNQDMEKYTIGSDLIVDISLIPYPIMPFLISQ